MPELPEVEVVRQQLKLKVLNKEIKDIISYHDNIFSGNIEDLKKALIGQSFIDVERYGKYLVFILSNEYVLISHLRMEGKYQIRDINDPINKHEHIIINFDDSSLRYHDTRKFGRMDLRLKETYRRVLPLSQLGHEPSNMDKDELYEKIHKKNVAIKVALLDQTIIAGLGNIYVDETLFMSNVSPLRRTNTITKDEANEITLNAEKVLDKALKLGGTTIRTFSATDMHGRFQNHLLVHTKAGHPCPVCGTTIEKTKVGGRGTYVCTNCQK